MKALTLLCLLAGCSRYQLDSRTHYARAERLNKAAASMETAAPIVVPDLRGKWLVSSGLCLESGGNIQTKEACRQAAFDCANLWKSAHPKDDRPALLFARCE